jgi:ubiquitin
LIAGHQLEDHELLEELPEECTLHLSLALLGAGKKRKKKTYTKPKKIKRKHKKVKLAVLKYYRVDQSGKVTRCKSNMSGCHLLGLQLHTSAFTCFVSTCTHFGCRKNTIMRCLLVVKKTHANVQPLLGILE